jgi:MFS transporter, DHA2 family, glioxin efflux transporter
VGKIGYYQPFLIVGSMLATIGGGLIYTFDIDTPSSKFIGYQVIAGTGIGLAIQIPIIVAQATSTRADVSIAMSTMLCKSALSGTVFAFAVISWPHRILLVQNGNVITVFQFVAGAIGVSSAQSIFNNRLITSLPAYAPDVTAEQVLAVGAYDLRGAFTDSQLPGVLQCYMVGLRSAWALSIALSGLTFVISFLAEWKSIKPKTPSPANAGSSTMACV